MGGVRTIALVPPSNQYQTIICFHRINPHLTFMSESRVSGGYGGNTEGSGGGQWGQRQRVVYDGKRMRKPVVRKTIDFNTTVARYLIVGRPYLHHHKTHSYTHIYILTYLHTYSHTYIHYD